MAALLERFVQMKIAALSPFPFMDAEFGGGQRIDNLLTSIDNEVRVFIANGGAEGRGRHKNLDVSLHPVPISTHRSEYDMDVAAASKRVFGPLIEEYDPDLVILEHPWQVRALSGQKHIYDAHNNESHMKSLISSDDVVQETQKLEAKALEADHVTYCSVADQIETNSPKTWIPNGTDIPEIQNSSGYESKILLFVGSAHPPNIGAALTLAQLAPALPGYEIVIAGSCGQAIQCDAPNVTLAGHVNKQMLAYLMRSARAFINPIAAGSGTSLKVISALSYGLPTISSKFGARGYEDSCIIANNAQEMISEIEALGSRVHWKEKSELSRNFAEDYSWDAIGATFNDVVMGMK